MEVKVAVVAEMSVGVDAQLFMLESVARFHSAGDSGRSLKSGSSARCSVGKARSLSSGIGSASHVRLSVRKFRLKFSRRRCCCSNFLARLRLSVRGVTVAKAVSRRSVHRLVVRSSSLRSLVQFSIRGALGDRILCGISSSALMILNSFLSLHNYPSAYFLGLLFARSLGSGTLSLGARSSLDIGIGLCSSIAFVVAEGCLRGRCFWVEFSKVAFSGSGFISAGTVFRLGSVEGVSISSLLALFLDVESHSLGVKFSRLSSGCLLSLGGIALVSSVEVVFARKVLSSLLLGQLVISGICSGSQALGYLGSLCSSLGQVRFCCCFCY